MWPESEPTRKNVVRLWRASRSGHEVVTGFPKSGGAETSKGTHVGSQVPCYSWSTFGILSRWPSLEFIAAIYVNHIGQLAALWQNAWDNQLKRRKGLHWVPAQGWSPCLFGLWCHSAPGGDLQMGRSDLAQYPLKATFPATSLPPSYPYLIWVHYLPKSAQAGVQAKTQTSAAYSHHCVGRFFLPCSHHCVGRSFLAIFTPLGNAIIWAI